VDSWFFLSFPRCVDSAIAGLEKAKKPPAGKNVRRLIQIRLAPPSFEKISPVVK
jgi:hypothetical protein